MLHGQRLNRNIPVPLYFQLKELIKEEIKTAALPAGTLMPTERELSETFLISRTTVHQAIGELLREKWLYRIKGKGTFVASMENTSEAVNDNQLSIL